MKTKENEAPDIDGISPMVLKNASGLISDVLSFFVQLEFPDIFPKRLKTTTVLPIRKKGIGQLTGQTGQSL